VEQYFTYSYSFSFNKTVITGNEVFYVTASGQATCIKDLPLPVSEASIVSRVVARHQQTGTEVVLNANYSMSYSSFPTKKGETVTPSPVQVPLSIPDGAAAGAYTVTAYILEARVKISFLPSLNVSNEFPPSETMGSVTYQPGSAVEMPGGLGGIVITGPLKPDPATDLSRFMDTGGVFTEETWAKSIDGAAKITFPKGTIFKTQNGGAGTGVVVINVEKGKEPPAPPDGTIIGQVFTLGPEGATFNPPARLTISYDEAGLPEDLQENNLVIAWWNTVTGKWEQLTDCIVDGEANTVTGPVAHFTVFSIIGKASPAQFDFSLLTISPASAKSGETVLVSISVANSGGSKGAGLAVLKINGVEEDRQEATLASGASRSLSFMVVRNPAATYGVEVNGLTGSFTIENIPVTPVPAPVPELQPATMTTPEPEGSPVDIPAREPMPPPPAANGWLLAILIGAGIVVGGLGIYSLYEKTIGRKKWRW
jgi:hypothetical protein